MPWLVGVALVAAVLVAGVVVVQEHNGPAGDVPIPSALNHPRLCAVSF